MKRILSLFLIVALLLSGCGGNKSTADLSGQKSAAPESADTVPEAGETAADSGTGTSPPGVDLNDIDVDITEKMYVTYINEIYVNTDDYIGQMIRIEGMFQAYKDENTGITYYYVYRTGPGCCGNDGSMCGFEFTWSGEMPKDNDWIEVVGKLRTYEEDGYTYLTLDAESVTVLDVRGAENVYQ